jgi:lactate/malate dehydrogenase, NAD binding domain
MAFGSHTAPGQTRLDLARANLAICEEVAGHVEVGGLPRVCLVATSPLDVLTEYLTRRWAGRMVDVIGSGTSLDTWRLRGELSLVCPRTSGRGARVGRRRARRLRCAAVQFGNNRRPHTAGVRSADGCRLVRRAAGSDCRDGTNCCVSSARTQGLDMGCNRTCDRGSGAQHRPRPRPSRSRFGPRRRSALRQLALRARSRGCGQATSPEDGRAGGSCLGTKPRRATSGIDSAPMMSTVCIDAAVGDQSAAVGEDDRLGPVVHVDLGQDPFDVSLRGRLRNHQQVGNLGVRSSLSHQK